MLAGGSAAAHRKMSFSGIALIGLRGAGKSTLGRKLAAALDRPFIELADEIAAIAGMSIDQIFDLSGQAGYRRYEKRALERVLEAGAAQAGSRSIVMRTSPRPSSEMRSSSAVSRGPMSVPFRRSCAASAS